MNAGARIAIFVALLAVLFAGSALAGRALDPSGGDGGGEHKTGATYGEQAGGAPPGADRGDEHARAAAPAATRGALPAGVASAQKGLRLVVDRSRFQAGRAGALRFRILDAGNRTVRAFETEQARRLHLIVVRRDLRRYQHLHPVQGADGAWAIDLTLPDAGVYRAFADFRTGGEQHTLGIDLFVPGSFDPLDLPPAANTARTGGYEVVLSEQAGETSFVVRRGARIVGDLQPYLGARGHLVALREGDLAYEHVHPERGGAGRIAFQTGAPEPGTYRLFVQFRHRDRVRTAAFTRVVTR